MMNQIGKIIRTTLVFLGGCLALAFLLAIGASADVFEDEGCKIYYAASTKDLSMFEATVNTTATFQDVPYYSSTPTSYPVGSDRGVKFTVSGNGQDVQTMIHIPGGINTSDYNYIAITVRTSKDMNGDVFFLDADDQAHGGKSVDFSCKKSDTFQTIYLSVKGKEGWAGTIPGLRFDYCDNGTPGEDWCMLDSVAFCKTTDDEDFVRWQRKRIRYMHGNFLIDYVGLTDDPASEKTKEELVARNAHFMTRLFQGTQKNVNHNVVAIEGTDNSAYESNLVVLRMEHNCTHTEDVYDKNGNVIVDNGSKHPNSIYLCGLDGYSSAPDADKAAHDPSAYFNIPGTIEDEYNYLVLVYEVPPGTLDNLYFNQGVYFPGENEDTFKYYYKNPYYNPNSNDDRNKTQYHTLYWDEPHRHTNIHQDGVKVEIFLEDKEGHTVAGLSARYELRYDEVEYTNYVDLDSIASIDKKMSDMHFIRIDPFDVLYANPGTALHIKGILFCKDLDRINELLPPATLYYKVIAPDGTVVDTSGNKYATLTQYSEKIYRYDDAPSGVTVTPRAGYQIEGWYENLHGLEILEKKWLSADKTTLTPVKDKGVIWDDGEIFYVRLDYLLAVTSAAKPNEVYDGFSDGETTVSVLKDRAFTIQYAFTGAYSNVNFISDQNLPPGTKLILLDLTDGDEWTVFSHTLTVASKRIPLSDFIPMGGGTATPAEDASVFVLCVDLFDAEGVTPGAYTIQVEDADCLYATGDIGVTLVDFGTVTVTDQTASAPAGTLSVDVTVSGTHGTPAAIAVELYGEDGTIPMDIPAGAELSITPPLSATATLKRTDTHVAFFEMSGDGIYTVKMTMNEAHILASKTYRLKVTLCDTTMAPAYPMAEATGTDEKDITVAPYIRHAISISSETRQVTDSTTLTIRYTGTVSVGTKPTPVATVQYREDTKSEIQTRELSTLKWIRTEGTITESDGVKTMPYTISNLAADAPGLYVITFEYGDAQFRYAFIVIQS